MLMLISANTSKDASTPIWTANPVTAAIPTGPEMLFSDTSPATKCPMTERSRRPSERIHLRPPPLQDNIQADACGLYRVRSVNTWASGLDEKTGIAAVSEVEAVDGVEAGH